MAIYYVRKMPEGFTKCVNLFRMLKLGQGVEVWASNPIEIIKL